MSDWYRASLMEIQAFLDQYEEKERVVVTKNHDLIPALVAMLEASSLVYRAAEGSLVTASALAALER